MAQFTVYRNPNRRTQPSVPYLLDLQTDMLSNLATRVVAPLVPVTDLRPAAHLNPTFEIEGETMVMSTGELAGVPLAALGEPIASLEAHRVEIIAALDFVFTGI